MACSAIGYSPAAVAGAGRVVMAAGIGNDPAAGKDGRAIAIAGAVDILLPLPLPPGQMIGRVTAEAEAAAAGAEGGSSGDGGDGGAGSVGKIAAPADHR